MLILLVWLDSDSTPCLAEEAGPFDRADRRAKASAVSPCARRARDAARAAGAGQPSDPAGGTPDRHFPFASSFPSRTRFSPAMIGFTSFPALPRVRELSYPAPNLLGGAPDAPGGGGAFGLGHRCWKCRPGNRRSSISCLSYTPSIRNPLSRVSGSLTASSWGAVSDSAGSRTVLLDPWGRSPGATHLVAMSRTESGASSASGGAGLNTL